MCLLHALALLQKFLSFFCFEPDLLCSPAHLSMTCFHCRLFCLDILSLSGNAALTISYQILEAFNLELSFLLITGVCS